MPTPWLVADSSQKQFSMLLIEQVSSANSSAEASEKGLAEPTGIFTRAAVLLVGKTGEGGETGTAVMLALVVLVASTL